MQKINSNYFKRFLFCFLFVAFAFLLGFSATLIPKNTTVLADGEQGITAFGESDGALPNRQGSDFTVESFEVFLADSLVSTRTHLGYGKTLLANSATMSSRLYITTDLGTLSDTGLTDMQLRFYPNNGGAMQWANFVALSSDRTTIYIDLANAAANPNLTANPFFNNGGRWEIGEKASAASNLVFTYPTAEFPTGTTFRLDENTGTYLFDVYPRSAVTLENATVSMDSSANNLVYTRHLGNTSTNLPTLGYDTKFFVPVMSDKYHDYKNTTGINYYALTDAVRYVITLNTIKHASFPALLPGYTMTLNFSATVDIFGAKILHHSIRKDEFIKFDDSNNLLTPEIVTPTTITGAGTTNLLLNGVNFFDAFDKTYSTNRIGISWSLNPQPITLISGTPNGERTEQYTVPTATRYFALDKDTTWSQHTFNPRSTIGQTGYHVVQIINTRYQRNINQQGQVTSDTVVGTPHVQTFAFFVRNINPRIRLETFRQEFAPDDAAIDAAFPLTPVTIGGGGITNQPVTIMIDGNDISIFDDAPSFTLQLIGGSVLNQVMINGLPKSVTANQKIEVQAEDEIGLINPAGAKQQFLITTEFGVENHNDERSAIYTDFVIDNRPVQLIPFKQNILEDVMSPPPPGEERAPLPPRFSTLDITTNHIGLMTDEGVVYESFGILANLQKEMSRDISNMLNTLRSNEIGVVAQTDLSQIERAEYRATYLRRAQNFADVTDAILDGDANYISALFGADNRSGWTTFLGDVSNINFTHGEAGLYEFRFMDRASNISYFFVYIDLLAPNPVYVAEDTKIGASTPWEDEFVTHNVYFGEYKAVKLSTTVAPLDSIALVPMPDNTFAGDKLTLRHDGRNKSGYAEIPVLKSEIGSSGKYDYYLLTSIAKPNLSEVPPTSNNYIYKAPSDSLSPDFLNIEEMPSRGGRGGYQPIDFYKAPFNGKEPGTNNAVDLIIDRPGLAPYYTNIRNAIKQYSRGITNTHFFVSEYLTENEGRYQIDVRDQFGNSGYNQFRIDFDPTQIAFLAKTSPSDSADNYFGKQFADIRNGTGDDATGTNFGTIDVRSLATHNAESVVDFNLTEIKFEHIAPNYSQLSNIYGAAGTSGTLFDRAGNLGTNMINTDGVFYKPELNTTPGTSTTQQGKYQISRKIVLLNGSTIELDGKGKPKFALSETYTIYVDRTGVITSISLDGDTKQQIGKNNQVDVYSDIVYSHDDADGNPVYVEVRNKYLYGETWQYGDYKQINLDNLGNRIQRDDNGEIETVLGLDAVYSNLTNAALTIQKQKYDTNNMNGLPPVFELKSETVTIGAAGFERSLQTQYADTSRYSIIVSDGLNSTIKLSNTSKTLYGNASAFAFELNNTKPRGTAKEATTSNEIEQFVLKEVEGIRWENVRPGQWSEPEYSNLKNTYFVKPSENNFLFEVTNDLAPEGISAIVNYKATKVYRATHNGSTIEGTWQERPELAGAGTGQNGFAKQILSLPRPDDDASGRNYVYRIELFFFDITNNLLSTHNTATYYVFVDGAAPTYNLDKIKGLDYFTLQLTRNDVTVPSTFKFDKDYVYMLPTTFAFTRQGDIMQRTTHLDSSTLYFRPKGGVGQNWLALEYNKPFGLQGLYEIKELDAAGNETTYIVQFGNPDVHNKLLAYDYNYAPQVKVNSQQTVSANPAEWVDSGAKTPMEFNAVPRLDITTSPLTNGIDATLSRRLGLEMNWIDSDDAYFLVEVTRTFPAKSIESPTNSNRVIFPIYAKKDQAQVITNAIAERILATSTSEYYKSDIAYEKELGSQYAIKILDRMTTAENTDAIKYFEITLNLSPQKRARPTEAINGALPMSDYIGLNRAFVNINGQWVNPDGQLAVYWSHDIASLPHYNIENTMVEKQYITTENGNQITIWNDEHINNFSSDKNSPMKFSIGIYRITYKNNFGYEFIHYLSDPVTSAYFSSQQGAGINVNETVQNVNDPSKTETIAVPYFGDNLFDDSDPSRPIGNFSFTFNHQAFTFEQLVVSIGNTTQYLKADQLGQFAEVATAPHPLGDDFKYFTRSGSNDIINFKPTLNANIRYTVILRYREGIGEADGPRLLAVHAGYYTIMPRIQMRDQFDMFRQLVVENPFIATSAKIEAISTEYMGEAIKFFDYQNPIIWMSAKGYRLDGSSEDIKFGDQLSATVPPNYTFSASGSGFSRIEFILTIINDVGTFASYQIIIDSSSRPPYVVMQGNTELRASSERWKTGNVNERFPGTENDFLAKPYPISALTQREYENGFYSEMYYTTGTISTSMIIPDLDRGLNRVERVDNGGLCVNSNNIQLFKVFSDSPHITSVYFIRISYVAAVTASQDLNGLSLKYSNAQPIGRVQHRLFALANQDTIHILFAKNHTNWRPIEGSGSNPADATTTIYAPYYGMQFYAEVEIEGNKTVDLMGSIHLTASGIYKIKYYDLAGNVQRFTYNGITYDYQEAILMNNILISATAANTVGTMELQNDMVLESLPGGQNVSLSVTRSDIYLAGSIKISNMTRNGIRYGEQVPPEELASLPGPYWPIDNLRLDLPGVYVITLQGTIPSSPNRAITTTYRIFVINPREQRLGLDLVFANTFGARQTIESISQSFLGQFPIEINRSDLLSAPFTKVVLSPFDSGSGRYKVRVAVNSGSVYKETEYYWFEVLIGGPTPFVTTSVKPGSSTSSKAYITFNPGYIYENFGAARILINGEIVQTINHASSYNDMKITLSMGQNVVEIQTESGALNFVRFTINRTKPLGALTIVIITVCSILFVVAVIVFFRLRTKMKVK